MRWIKIPPQDFGLKMQGGLMREGGVFAGHYGIYKKKKKKCDRWSGEGSPIVM